MHKIGEPCDILIAETENSLSNEVVMLMLLATQRGNLERSVKSSLRSQVLHRLLSTHMVSGGPLIAQSEMKSNSILSCAMDIHMQWIVGFQTNHITDTLNSMIGKIGSATFNDGHTPQYTLLVSILLLECTAILFVTTDATLDTALDEAYSRLNSLSSALKAELFSFVSQNPTTDDYFAFILKHRLGVSSCFSLVSNLIIFSYILVCRIVL
ncbi:hypothetical protein HD554DRAFT_1242678 [Boletus coccyginus]|nr:hypothetical protein HD554DRAFT_1242678 [Boletus coccyginus]